MAAHSWMGRVSSFPGCGGAWAPAALILTRLIAHTGMLQGAYIIFLWLLWQINHQPAGLEQQTRILAQFWRPEVWTQFHWSQSKVLAGSHSFLRLKRKTQPSCFWGCRHSLVCEQITSASTCLLHILFSVYMLTPLLFVSDLPLLFEGHM